MNFAINDTAEDANIVVNIERLLPEVVSFIMEKYAYLFIGIVLTLISIPAFPLMIIRKTLRDSSAILAVTFLNSELIGIIAILLGVKRTIVSVGEERLIDHDECVLNVCLLMKIIHLCNSKP
ncbi:unnamed protein product [Onchocerca ochengi]|uniref:G_PROTEIN_RECEP_F1_2 domain-containing protein n=1 Tax=Onchocerca ochengi TaxID=42157 RepID=A0A182ELE5_ONCOC|nr:unnamed protein product [Onchocerca ochengi]